MFNLGFSELLLLGLIALIFIGPQQLPELARAVGRVLNELKRATSDFQSVITDDFKADIKQRLDEHKISSIESELKHQAQVINEQEEENPNGEGQS